MNAMPVVASPHAAAVPTPPATITLLDLVTALGDAGASDREVVAAVVDLLERGRVRLIGPIRVEPIAPAS